MKKLSLQHIRHSNYGLIIKNENETVIVINDILKKMTYKASQYHPYSQSIKLELMKHHAWSGKRQVFKNKYLETSIHRLFIN
jgi:hypothetical protein